MKIGIGITTTPERQLLQNLCELQVFKHTHQNKNLFKTYTHVDVEKRGVAYSKNVCLHELRDCDHIFLLDDDCFPVKDNWCEYFISSNVNHLLFLRPDIHVQISETFYKLCGGVFMYISKQTFETIGYFNSRYKQYGYEHSAYSQRAHRAGLIPHPFICMPQTFQYLHSFDYNKAEFNDPMFNGFEHKVMFTQQEKTILTLENEKYYIEEKQSEQIFYTFEPTQTQN